jgi:hypothetical protein
MGSGLSYCFSDVWFVCWLERIRIGIGADEK